MCSLRMYKKIVAILKKNRKVLLFNTASPFTPKYVESDADGS